MSEYVWCTADVHLADGVYMARLLPGQVWWADDPLVAAHRDLFSATPLQVNGSTGRAQPGLTPVVLSRPMTAAEFAAEVEQAKAAFDAGVGPEASVAETDPVVEAAPVRRGPGRPRRG